MRKLLTLWICICMLLLSCGVIVDHNKSNAQTPNSVLYTTRTPINIYNDADLILANGVTGGSGTVGDPFIIQGWEILVTKGQVAVNIINTDAYLTVQHCSLTNMVILNANNCTVFNNTFIEGNCDIDSASHLRICNNNFTQMGMDLYQITDVAVYNNKFQANQTYSVQVYYAKAVSFWNNTFKGCGIQLNFTSIDTDTIQISINNTANAKPIRFLHNTSSVVLNQATPVGQLIISNSTNIHVSNLTVSNTSIAFQVYGSHDVHFERVNCSNNSVGYMISSSSRIIVGNCSMWNDSYGFDNLYTWNSIFINLQIMRSGYGYRSMYCGGNRFINVSCKYDEQGITYNNGQDSIFHEISCDGIAFDALIVTGPNNKIENSHFKSGSTGIWLSGPYNNIANCTFQDNTYGIYLFYMDNSSLINNTFDHNGVSIHGSTASDIHILNNTIGHSSIGIRLWDGVQNDVRGNRIVNNTYTHHTDNYYFPNQDIYQNDANGNNYSSLADQLIKGQLWSEPIYSRQFNMTNNSLFAIGVGGLSNVTGMYIAIFYDGMAGSLKDGAPQSREAIKWRYFTNATDYINLDYPRDGSYFLIVFGMVVTGNLGHFDLYVNITTSNSTAFDLTYTNSYIHENLIQGNTIGMFMWPTSNVCRIYNNNFIANVIHAVDMSTDLWDSGVMIGGNYWDNWTTPDADHDGYVDQQFIINRLNIDNYPFAEPWHSDTVNPTANTGPDRAILQGGRVVFNAQNSTDDVGIVNYSWEFTYDNAKRPFYGITSNFTFIKVGSYPVNLTVLDAGGNAGSDQMVVIVNDGPNPIARAGPDQTINQGEVATFNGTLSTGTLPIANYTWSFIYNLTTIVLKGPVASYRFYTPGNYSVNLTVNDISGDFGTDQLWVSVLDTISPVARAGNDITVSQGMLVLLNATASTDNVGITNYTWSFTYNNTNTVLYGVLQYFRLYTVGKYLIKLNVSDAAANVGLISFNITVRDSISPWVVSIRPQGQSVPINASIAILFSERMNTSAVQSSIGIYPLLPNITYIWDATGTNLKIASTDLLQYGMNYTISIGIDASDINGRQMQTPYNWNFTTETLQTRSDNSFYIYVIIIIITAISIIILYAYVYKRPKRK
jgi:parallel beta-helix repeat protein